VVLKVRARVSDNDAGDPAMRTPTVSIVYFLIASLLGAVGQFLYKSGAERAGGSLGSYLNARILAGAAAYIAVMVLFVAAFRRGGELSVLYPVYATTFIWAAIISCAAYGTPIKPVHAAGMALLVAGMWLMGR
jgi:multidrug transporter EmrE-like cation transporter